MTTDETNAAFKAILSSSGSGKAPARVDEATCDDVNLQLNEHDVRVGSKVSAKIRIANNGSEKFYASYADLLSSASIKSGVVPASFYIIKDDEFLESGNTAENDERYSQLLKICEMIIGLKKLAHYYDKTTKTSPNTLVFLAGDSHNSHPIVLDICLRESALTANLSDINVLTSLLSDKAKLEAHFEPQKGIFYSSLGEFLSGLTPESAFCKLIENWIDFAAVYQRNYSTYLSGFAFHKAKKEVAESEVKIAEQLSKVTSDLTGKLFSIPISIAAVVTMFSKSSTFITNGLVVFGLLLAALLIVGIIANQKNQLDSVKQAKDIIEQSIEGNKNSYPAELLKHIEGMSKRLDSHIRTAGCWLFIFRLLAWVPALLGIVVFYFQYSSGLLIVNIFNLYQYMFGLKSLIILI
ncbi:MULTISPECIES: hypothetical protein [Vibrio]|uniref:hypothetical protein n=1 Tax=Vibrio TaxID=662 RepID=UPI00104A5833|nr:hypothetical protein [Vibrio crassostreae]